MTTVDGQRPACREQKAALQQAKTRLEYCREKLDVVRKWRRNFRHDSLEFRGRVGHLRRVIELEAPTARAVLAKLLNQLEQYQLERPPEGFHSRGVSTESTAETTTRTLAGTPAQGAEPPDAGSQVDRTSTSETTR